MNKRLTNQRNGRLAARRKKSDPAMASRRKNPSPSRPRKANPGTRPQEQPLPSPGFFDSAPVAYLSFDSAARICEFNFTAVEMLACDDTDLPNLSFPVLVHPADTEIFYNHLRRCRQCSRGRVVTELRLRGRSKMNGTVRDLPVQLVSVPAGQNGQVVFRTVLVDLTATKAAERAAHDSMIYAEQIIQTVQHPLVIVDSGLRVQTVNAAFCRVFRDEARRIELQPLQELETVRWKDDELLLRLKEVIDRKSTRLNSSH